MEVISPAGRSPYCQHWERDVGCRRLRLGGRKRPQQTKSVTSVTEMKIRSQCVREGLKNLVACGETVSRSTSSTVTVEASQCSPDANGMLLSCLSCKPGPELI